MQPVVILHEQEDDSTTIIEKFDRAATQAGFAVAILTADDVGGAKADKDVQPRARQNVIFEAGYCAGLLGRGKVTLLLGEGVEKPSDLDGFIYISLGEANWRTKLWDRMKASEAPLKTGV